MMTKPFFKGKRFALILLAMFTVMTVFSVTTALEVNFTTYKRVIADGVGPKDVLPFIQKGCILKHNIGKGISFDCPEGVISSLKVRESRIFKITDLNADKQIEADKIWPEGVTGSGVNVAVLDTGMDLDHPELADSYLGGYDFVNNDAIPDDDQGHGSHVAGIITGNGVSSNAKGVAPGAKIYMYKVCNSAGNCYEDDMVAAMEAAMKTDAKVMSISIGGGSYTAANCDSDHLAVAVNKVA
jgi:subtilisin family serine protease